MTGPIATRGRTDRALVVLLGAFLLLALAGASQARAAKPVVGLKASSAAISSGQAVRLAGVVKRGAKGQRVVLLAKLTGSRWARAGVVRLPANRRFAFRVRPPLGRTAFRAVALPRGRTRGARSKVARVLGRPAVSSTRTLSTGNRVKVGGRLPTRVKRKVVLQRRAGGRWRAVAARASTAKGFVTFSIVIPATAVYRLYAPAFRQRAASRGKAKRRARGVRVYPAFASPTVRISVQSGQSVKLTLPDDVCTSQDTDASMSFSPSRSNWRFTLQISEDEGGSWKAVVSGGQGASAEFLAPDVSGTYHYRVVAVDPAGRNAGTSNSEEVEVRLCATPPPLPQIYGGATHSCEIDAFGVTWCWGEGRFGQLGDGTNAEQTKPVEVSGGHKFVDLGLGTEHTCGIVESGKAYCWGSNGSAPTEGSWVGVSDNGALGDGTETNRSVPTPVSGGHRFVQITAGQGHTCGLATTGVVYCWGYNRYGEVGDGSLDTRLAPTRVIGGGFDEIDALGWSTCGLSGGRVFCWGRPTGNTPYTPKPEDGVPAPVGGSYPSLHGIETDYVREGCALSAAGTAYCWGDNSYGRLGRGPGADSDPEPGPVTGDHTFTDVAAGNNYVCGLTDENSVLCWGYNNFGPLGRGSNGGLNSHSTPEPVAGGHAFTRVGVGYGHSCAIDTGGFAWCWGFNAQGQIGNGIADLLSPALQPNTVLFPGIDP